MLSATFLSACLLGSLAAASAETRVLEGFTLIDGTGHQPLPNAAMIVTDGRIRWVGPQSRLEAPAGAERVNLEGKFIMPGIMDLHTHVGNAKGLVNDPKNFTRENVEEQLKTYASYGVTSVLSMGSDQPLIFDMRAKQRGTGRPAEARIFTAGRGFAGVGGYPTQAPGMKGIPFEVSNVAEIDKDVQWLADHKVDMVKTWVDDHLGRMPKIPLDLASHIIQDAHQHNLIAGDHVFYLADAKALVDAGLNGLAHSVRDKAADESLIASMKKHGTYQQAATLVREASLFVFAKPSPMLDDPFFTRSIPPDVLRTIKTPEYRKKVASDEDFARYPEFLANAQHNLKREYDAGIKIAFGTDSGQPARFPGSFEHWEMELMAESGIPPLQIITCASKNASEYLRVSKDLGTLEAGKWADLIVLAKNPVLDIKNTRSIEKVLIAGNEVK